jgi:hypothetical protein
MMQKKGSMLNVGHPPRRPVPRKRGRRCVRSTKSFCGVFSPLVRWRLCGIYSHLIYDESFILIFLVYIFYGPVATNSMHVTRRDAGFIACISFPRTSFTYCTLLPVELGCRVLHWTIKPTCGPVSTGLSTNSFSLLSLLQPLAPLPAMASTLEWNLKLK